MKIIKLTLLSFGILFGSAVFAQERMHMNKKDRMSKEVSQEIRSDNFGHDLDLTAKQREQIAEIRKRTNEERPKLRNTENMDKSKLGEAMKELRNKERADISRILTDEQRVKFEAKREKRRSNHEKKDHKSQMKKSSNRMGHKKGKRGASHQNINKENKQLLPAKE